MTLNAVNNGVRLALANTREHKMRSFLTILGVIIGTGAVIGVGSIIAGLDGVVANLLRSMGPDTIIVLKGKVMGGWTKEEMRRKTLTLENARAVAERCPSVRYVSPYIFPMEGHMSGGDSARYRGNEVYNIALAGTEETYSASGATMKFGRFFSAFENTHHEPVAVVGEDIYKQLLQNEYPIDKWVQVNGHALRIVGVMDRPAASVPGQDDLRVLIPYFTMRKMFPNLKEHMLLVIAWPGMVDQAQDEVRAVLRQERRLGYKDPDNFSISTAEQILDRFRQVTGTVALVMVILSSIGLLVGGIGVMNIMLVSVTERTREIGIRKAVGARKSDIVVQFLTEAVVLTGLGGTIGLLIGWAISRVTGMVFANLPTAVPVWAAVAGVMMSVGVGLFFGIWPASRAARLDPVEALRYE
jgi:putative ABC transport system permease protein